MINFGDCFDGEIQWRETTLHNLSDTPLQLDLVNGVPPNVTFHLAAAAPHGALSSDHHGRQTGMSNQSVVDWPPSMASSMASVPASAVSSSVADLRRADDGQEESRCRQLQLAPGQHRKVREYTRGILLRKTNNQFCTFFAVYICIENEYSVLYFAFGEISNSLCCTCMCLCRSFMPIFSMQTHYNPTSISPHNITGGCALPCSRAIAWRSGGTRWSAHPCRLPVCRQRG